MSFTRLSANLTPIEDQVFKVVALAKEDELKNGTDKVINATIGSLYNEEGQLVAYKSVFDHFDALPHTTKAAYASSFSGNEDYRKQVISWVLKGRKLNLHKACIATPGGSGAVSSTLINILEQGQTVVMPDIAWGSYKLMASQNNLKMLTYAMFDGDKFNIDSFKAACLEVIKTQDKLLVVINDPCHNPTGYSMSNEEWLEVVEFLNECSLKVPCVLLNDIAYIDYGFDNKHTRDYLRYFENIADNLLVIIAFSISKTCTSYGLRCGAAVMLGSNQQKVREVEIVFEKTARALWSNITNAAMDNFTWLTTENVQAFMDEKQSYIDLMIARSSLFLNEANACDLVYYPFKEGFFITLKVEDDDLLERFHQALIKEHIYTVKVYKGIRIALCSLSIEKIKGLAPKIKQIYTSCL